MFVNLKKMKFTISITVGLLVEILSVNVYLIAAPMNIHVYFFLKSFKLSGYQNFYRGLLNVSKKNNTPSDQVDQKELLDDKVKEARKNNFEEDHVRRVTSNGAQGQ